MCWNYFLLLICNTSLKKKNVKHLFNYGVTSIWAEKNSCMLISHLPAQKTEMTEPSVKITVYWRLGIRRVKTVWQYRTGFSQSYTPKLNNKPPTNNKTSSPTYFTRLKTQRWWTLPCQKLQTEKLNIGSEFSTYPATTSKCFTTEM